MGRAQRRRHDAAENSGDEALLAAVAAGDRAAFATMVRRYLRPMLAVALRVTRNPDEAEEIVQETFLKIWRLAGQWRPEREARFSTWLYRVVLNASLDRQRRPRVVPLEAAGDPADLAPGGLDLVQAHQRDAIVAAALAEIPSRQRTALALYYFSDLSVSQTAATMGLSVTAVESLLVRGKRALRLALARRGITAMGDVS